ncbi:hypothetical protein [Leptospira noguchii]|uniref:Uncharacterized protein n=1 Tax=Leptospira noguchii serovar Panama str. CZ214 TaxID=1001595 RepID=T0FMH4_9LEPT|nr:hypothetical protein [Leptospira noguchii]EQA71374.1 hypothetical protein LEP1GSC059_2763 [Leptospira noguchii serovar Panama str. CZ214]
MKRILFIITKLIVSLILLFALSIVLFFAYKEFQKENLKRNYRSASNLNFSFQICNTNGGRIFEDRIESVDWINPHTVHVKAKVCSNCGDYDWVGDYKEIGNSINLLYNTFSDGYAACGCCPVIMKFEISNIEKKKYKYRIQMKERVFLNTN